jgi:hypothetical protein
MAWLRVDDGFPEHHKILALGGPAQRWAWVEVLAYCARARTRGRIPEGIGDIVRRADSRLISRAKSVGLIDVDEAGVMHVHDWNAYNGDPTNAERQRRFRERRNSERNADVTDDVTDETVTVTGLARSRARATPTPTPKGSTAAGTTEDPAAAEALTRQLQDLGWRHPQITRAAAEPERAAAWAAHAAAHAATNPGGFAWAGFNTGEWPAPNGKPERPLADVLEAFVRNAGWQYPDPAILDEIDSHERKRGERLTDEQRDRVLAIAGELRDHHAEPPPKEDTE